MANFDVSNLLTAQQILKDKYAGAELRMKPITAFDLLSKNDEFIVGVETLKTRDDRPTELHYITRTKRASGSARAYNHTGTIDDTAKVTPTWTTKSDKFAISLKLLDKSLFDFNQVLANKFAQACMNVLEDKETEALAYLMAGRATQQPTITGIGTFNATNDAVEIAAANATSFIQRVGAVMAKNYFSKNEIDVVVDSILNIAIEQQMAQGAGNSTNNAFNQWQGKTIVHSVELADSDYASGCALVFPKGQVSALNWIPKQNRTGWGDYNSYVGGYGTFSFMGYQFAVHGYAQRADTSASNGDVQDVQMEFEVSLDSSYNKAPLSYTTGRTDSVIIEFGQAAV
jgi:hypothetical protein